MTVDIIMPRAIIIPHDEDNPGTSGAIVFSGAHFLGFSGAAWVQLDN